MRRVTPLLAPMSSMHVCPRMECSVPLKRSSHVLCSPIRRNLGRISHFFSAKNPCMYTPCNRPSPPFHNPRAFFSPFFSRPHLFLRQAIHDAYIYTAHTPRYTTSGLFFFTFFFFSTALVCFVRSPPRTPRASKPCGPCFAQR